LIEAQENQSNYVEEVQDIKLISYQAVFVNLIQLLIVCNFISFGFGWVNVHHVEEFIAAILVVMKNLFIHKGMDVMLW
jgi:hypothetical protein